MSDTVQPCTMERKPKKEQKTAKQIERHAKGIANHHRIDILFVVAENSGITLEKIAESLNANFKTISEHTHRLVKAGLLNKKYKGRSVAHELSPYGKQFYNFLKTFRHS